jgi:hypothetical protein
VAEVTELEPGERRAARTEAVRQTITTNPSSGNEIETEPRKSTAVRSTRHAWQSFENEKENETGNESGTGSAIESDIESE